MSFNFTMAQVLLNSDFFMLVPYAIVKIEFFIVLHVFLLESARIWVIPEIPWNRILAVLPAKIVISIPQNSGGFQNGHGITRMELTGTESPEYFFNSNSNF